MSPVQFSLNRFEELLLEAEGAVRDFGEAEDADRAAAFGRLSLAMGKVLGFYEALELLAPALAPEPLRRARQLVAELERSAQRVMGAVNLLP